MRVSREDPNFLEIDRGDGEVDLVRKETIPVITKRSRSVSEETLEPMEAFMRLGKHIKLLNKLYDEASILFSREQAAPMASRSRVVTISPPRSRGSRPISPMKTVSPETSSRIVTKVSPTKTAERITRTSPSGESETIKKTISRVPTRSGTVVVEKEEDVFRDEEGRVIEKDFISKKTITKSTPTSSEIKEMRNSVGMPSRVVTRASSPRKTPENSEMHLSIPLGSGEFSLTEE